MTGPPIDVISEYLEWTMLPFESEHLGRSCARISRISPETPAAALHDALDRIAATGVALVTARVPIYVDSVRSALADAGGLEIEHFVTFAKDLGPDAAGDLPEGTELGTLADADACTEIGRTAFTFDRFHRDERIDDAAADALKANWFRNACTGRADAVFVVREDGRAVAANACLVCGDAAIIDLIAVLPSHQGKGLARQLVDAATRHFASKTREIRVGTQIANLRSTKLYESCGFSPVEINVTYHIHLNERQ